MALVTYTLNADAFGTGFPNFIADFDGSLLNVPTTTFSEVVIDIEYLGDFGSPSGNGTGNEFRLNIEGNATNWFGGYNYSLTITSYTFSQAVWESIIADGVVNVTFDMGDNVRDYSLFNPQEERIHLSFSWNDSPVVTPGKPDPILLSGTSGNDFLPGTNGRDLINGGAGNDSIFAGKGDDIVNGGDGDDVIGGGDGADNLRGGAGNDTIFGGDGNDSLYGGGGGDVAWGGAGEDMIRGDAGSDVLGGGAGRDMLYGGDGADVVYGGADNDWLFGDAGNDTLFGGDGNDKMIGGAGNDLLWGGAGADTFVFGKNDGTDVVGGFNGKSGDRIDIGSQTYTVEENEEGFAVLDLSGGGSVTLLGISIGDVNSDWFLAA